MIREKVLMINGKRIPFRSMPSGKAINIVKVASGHGRVWAVGQKSTLYTDGFSNIKTNGRDPISAERITKSYGLRIEDLRALESLGVIEATAAMQEAADMVMKECRERAKREVEEGTLFMEEIGIKFTKKIEVAIAAYVEKEAKKNFNARARRFGLTVHDV